MARDFNQNNARIVNSDDLKVGTLQANDSKIYYPNNYGLDAFGMVKIDLPDYAIAFIEGNNSISEFYIPASVSSIRSYALSGFPNLNDLTIMNEEQEVVINTNALSGTKIGNKESGSKIWVVNTYYDGYVSDYGAYYNFGSFESEYWYTFNTTTTPQTTLTKSIVNALNIPSTKQGLVFPTYYTRFSSITIEDLTQIEKVWLKGCNNLIFEISELPNGWVYDNGKLYVSSADYEDFIDFHSGYESYIEIGWTLTISGSGELTADYVNNYPLNEVPVDLITKAIVPVTFTSYATGSITAIQTRFTSLRYLETTYEEGAMELSLSGDIVAKIVSIDKTLDEALVYARINPRGADAIIIPPYTGWVSQSSFQNKTKLVYVANMKVNGTDYGPHDCFTNCPNLIEANVHFAAKFNGVNRNNINNTFKNCSSLKRCSFSNDETYPITSYTSFLQNSCNNLTKILLNGFVKAGSVNLSSNTIIDRQALIDLFNSLGTPDTQQTLTIGATNIAKLTADDISIATAKNWILA